ncbi:MAG: hypothetical protein AB7H77_12595 [Bdellovibrionales bacterium]
MSQQSRQRSRIERLSIDFGDTASEVTRVAFSWRLTPANDLIGCVELQHKGNIDRRLVTDLLWPSKFKALSDSRVTIEHDFIRIEGLFNQATISRNIKNAVRILKQHIPNLLTQHESRRIYREWIASRMAEKYEHMAAQEAAARSAPRFSRAMRDATTADFRTAQQPLRVPRRQFGKQRHKMSRPETPKR